jgi:hypothetical protein
LIIQNLKDKKAADKEFKSFEKKASRKMKLMTKRYSPQSLPKIIQHTNLPVPLWLKLTNISRITSKKYKVNEDKKAFLSGF